ncbi:MAG: porin family protein [Bacteroidota bacterium]
MNLLKKAIFSLLFVAFASAMFAQVGVRAGITLPNYSGDETDGFDANLGLTLAALYEIPISDNFAIQPELAFVQKGYKFEADIFGTTFETKTRINHIDVPILAKVKFGNESVMAYAAAGPTLGYAISGSIEVDGDSESIDDWDAFNRFEIGASVGAGAGIPAGNGQVFLDVRYLLGLTNLADTDDDITVRNSGLNLSVGYMANLNN